jgi:hypothetical protein
VDTLELQIFRIYQDQAAALFEFPTSRTRRWEVNAGYAHYGFDFEALRIFYNAAGQELGDERVDIEDETFFGLDPSDDFHMATGSVAYVGDWSYFGFTSPVRGGRFRFELSPMVGDLNIVNGLADYRRYFNSYPFTLAFRGLHFGRYGPDAEGTNALFNQQLFLGYETLVRGYALESWSLDECATPQCPSFNRLVGSRIGVLNAELRVPLFGVPEFGLINFPFLPTELAAFFDAGVAWNSSSACEGELAARQVVDCTPVFKWDSPLERTPVASTGLSARMNVLGFMVFEVYYAYPFQRPEKGAHFGFNIAPGW